MSDRATVLQIYCALLARDPLAQQRFTELAVKEPANKIGADELNVLPLSQGDLFGEMRQ